MISIFGRALYKRRTILSDPRSLGVLRRDKRRGYRLWQPDLPFLIAGPPTSGVAGSQFTCAARDTGRLSLSRCSP